MPEMGRTVREADLADDAVTSAKIKDGEIVNADIAAAAAIAYSKLASDPRICRIKTGSYTGDGTTSQAITGVGFQPKFVAVWLGTAGEIRGDMLFEKTDQHDTEYSLRHSKVANYEHQQLDNRLISLDADGFTVDDDGNDSSPNTNGTTYLYVAFG